MNKRTFPQIAQIKRARCCAYGDYEHKNKNDYDYEHDNWPTNLQSANICAISG